MVLEAGAQERTGFPASLPPRPALVGRDRDLEAITELIVERVPIITVVATGGAGKTRLAAGVAHACLESFADQVFFVPLAGVTEPTGVPGAIAGTLQVRASADRTVDQAVADALRHRSALLILDNFEQILGAAPFVAQLVDQCPLLTVLVTSRAPLRISAERVYELAPLAADSPESSAVRLFCERARAANPAFTMSDANADVVVELCRRLDGLPLALELAASCLSVLAPVSLLDRLDRSGGAALRLFSRGSRDAPTRHQSLEETIQWSYDLLSPPAQRLLRELSVFEGGCTLSSIEAVCTGDGSDFFEHLNSLVDLRLVVSEGHGEPRFRLLETIREFAKLRLQAGNHASEVSVLSDRHCAYFQTVADRAQPGLESRDDGRWIARLEAEYLNLRAAFDHLDERGDLEGGLRMASALGWFWRLSGRGEEGRNRLKALYERANGVALDPLVEADALVMIGRLSADGGLIGEGRSGGDETVRYLEEGLALHRRVGEPIGIVRALESLVVALVQHERKPRAAALCSEALALAIEHGHSWWATVVLYSEVIIKQMNGDLVAALEAAERGRAIALADNDPRQAAVGILLVGTTHMFSYRKAEAEAALQEAYHQSLVHGDKRNAAFAAVSLGPPAWATGEYQSSARWTREALTFAQAVSEWRCIGLALANVTYLAEFIGAHTESARFQGAMRSDVDSFYRAMPPKERENIDRLAHRTIRSIGEESFVRNRARGERLPRNMAIEEALVFVESVINAEVEAMREGPRAPEAGGADPETNQPSVDGLSPREIEVLVHLASGESNQQIANALFLSVATIERHLVNVYRKIGVRRRAEATNYAIRHRFVPSP